MCVCQMIPSLPFHVNDRANNMKVGSIQNTRRIFIPSPPTSLPSYENIFNAGISSFMRHALTKVHPSFCASTPLAQALWGGGCLGLSQVTLSPHFPSFFQGVQAPRGLLIAVTCHKRGARAIDCGGGYTP